MNKLLETFDDFIDDFIDDCLLCNESICIKELELLVQHLIKDNEEACQCMKSL